MTQITTTFGDGAVELGIGTLGRADVAHVRMCRPERRNALNAAMIGGLMDAALELRRQDTVKAVILSGTDDVFSAGGDLDLFRQLQEAPSLTMARRMAEEGGRLCAEWSSLPQPTIAAIEGPAIGGGLSIAVSCDWRVMAEDAWIHAPEVQLGLNFGWQTLPRLTALCGAARTKTISLLGRRHGAAECMAWGLCDATSSSGGAVAAALEMAGEVCVAPSLGTRLVKRAITRQSEALLTVSGFADPDDLLLALQDGEGKASREAAIRALKDKKP